MTNIYDEHRHLYHYTDFAGLKGILESQTLWATHYKYLNDYTEIEHMRSTLVAFVSKTVSGIHKAESKASFAYRRRLATRGGPAVVSNRVAENVVAGIYNVSFGGPDERDHFSEPFIVSFCSHDDSGNYVQKNGLLSQWRAYGNRGGFAMVFDTKLLWELLVSVEPEVFGYTSFGLGDVVYDHQSERADLEFEDLFEVLRRQIQVIADGGDEAATTAVTEELFDPFIGAVTRFKHQGFAEELEVRLVAAPITESLHKKAALAGKKGESITRRPLKPILSRARGETKVPFIKINDGKGRKPLPIIRIFMTPHVVRLPRRGLRRRSGIQLDRRVVRGDGPL